MDREIIFYSNPVFREGKPKFSTSRELREPAFPDQIHGFRNMENSKVLKVEITGITNLTFIEKSQNKPSPLQTLRILMKKMQIKFQKMNENTQ